MANLIGNAPNQVPTNADLGELAYQNTDYVAVGNITASGAFTGTGNVTTTGNVVATGNVITTGNVVATGNVSGYGATFSDSATINGNVTAANAAITGNANIGNISLTTGTLSTGGNIFITNPDRSTDANAVMPKSYIDLVGIVFGV